MELSVSMNWRRGTAESLRVGGVEFLAGEMPLFSLRLRDAEGNALLLTAYDAVSVEETPSGAVYTLPGGIRVAAAVRGEGLQVWAFALSNVGALQAEWVRYPCFALKPLMKNGGEGTILFPYNEGALVDDAELYRRWVPWDTEYPSAGLYGMFPNMTQSPFLCYMAGGLGLYLAAEDPVRGPKAVDFMPTDTGVTLRMQTFCGAEPGADWAVDFPLVTRGFEGGWMDGAALYRNWFEAHLPEGLTKTEEDETLPAWYAESPLVVSYPVRGIHDMDEMKPNALFPYVNALPALKEIKEKTGSPVMALLMHWEGTAPWAPPYVWPPYGGEEAFNDFADALHAQGDTLGVYCSGFGYTLQSNLIAEYNKEEEFAARGLSAAVCTAPDHKTQVSRICTGQRRGLDICVGSPKGRDLLNEAYAPLFESKADYAQILDQNHGGGQYFCYANSHGHPSVPGPWMTDSMKELLSGWRKAAPDKLFGCESAAGEPFIPYLRFSDNRYELNWHIGRPVPLYAFLYHEYLRNFMGNQVSCGLTSGADTLCWRLGYSFAAGDAMTLVLLPDGRFLNDWGTRDFTHLPNRERALTFIGNMRKLFDEGAAPYLVYGRMAKTAPVTCGTVSFPTHRGEDAVMESVIATSWTLHGKKATLLVNPGTEDETVKLGEKTLTVPALNGLLLEEEA